MTTQLRITPLEPGYADVQDPNQIERLGGEGVHLQPSTQRMVIDIPGLRSSLAPVEIMFQPEVGAAAYDQIEIGSLLDDRIRLRSSIIIDMEQEGEFYIAKYDDLNEMGYGTDPIGAVEDLRQTLAELYWGLKENRERLGRDLSDTWRRLSELVYEA